MPDLNKKMRAQQDLEKGILHGIASEWEAARLCLEPDIQPLIRKPTFALADLKSQWANWSAAKRQITISRQLTLNYPWDSIRDVLLHEMAHQIASELFNASARAPHGTAFQRACKLLRIDPAASADYQPLYDRLMSDHSGIYDKRMLKIKKLLALAESKNRFEAEAAMTKAHELIARHNVELNNHPDERQFLSVFIGSPALRHPREDYHLANLLQDFYFVCGIWVPSYVLPRGKMGRVLEISGTAPNLKMADYVHDFIRTFIECQWSAYNRDRGLNRYRKTDFAVGIIEGFRAKLENHINQSKTSPNVRALIRKKDPRLQKYYRFRYPHTASIQRAASRQDARVLKDGKKVGQKLVIARGICERKKGKPRLIGEQ
ncbi:MAG: DUF2786 domain-containing protein [Desulfobacterales bacterium]|jgi:hypothetical protein